MVGNTKASAKAFNILAELYKIFDLRTFVEDIQEQGLKLSDFSKASSAFMILKPSVLIFFKFFFKISF